MIPELERFDALLRQIFLSHFVPPNSLRQAVLKAVEFDVQLCIGTIEIQNMFANCVLPTKFDAGELSSSQCLPKLFFFISLIAA